MLGGVRKGEAAVSGIDETHDLARRSWVESANSHADFPIQNLPLGIFSPPVGHARPGVAIGDLILDLGGIGTLLPDRAAQMLTRTTLNGLMGLPAADRVALRRRLSALLSDERHRSLVEPVLYPASDCVLHLPATIGDYTDFYVGIHHATNVGALFRPDNPLLPNYKYVPIGYHGRASSVRPSGVPVVRPNGQRKRPEDAEPSYGPSRRLDYELELGIWVGEGNALGQPIPIDRAYDHIAGFCLLNDWSARDIQAWEYQPLGPFLAKNFHTTISPWVVTAEALEPFRVAQPPRAEGDPAPLPYLFDTADQQRGAYALELEVRLSSARMREQRLAPVTISRGSSTAMYWTMAQIMAHHASNGCNLQPGDLIGTGTISGAEQGSFGSLLEISEGGRKPVSLPSGEARTFLEDGDEVMLHAAARADGFAPIGFGPCSAVILPAP
jgi:fumarylacetoacetase